MRIYSPISGGGVCPVRCCQTDFNQISILASAYSQNSDELYDEYEDQPQHLETEMMKAPTFLSLAGQFSVSVGETVRLPCLVDRLEGFVILWKKGTTILTVASQIIDKVNKTRITEVLSNLLRKYLVICINLETLGREESLLETLIMWINIYNNAFIFQTRSSIGQNIYIHMKVIAVIRFVRYL